MIGGHLGEGGVIDWKKFLKQDKTELTQFWGIEWSSEGLVGAVVRLESSRVELTEPFSISLGSRTIERDGAEIAAELFSKVGALGAGAPCVLIMPREGVVVRQLQLPIVPPEELPALVAFQSAAKSSTPTTAIAVDYVPLNEQAEGQSVLAATLDSARVGRLREILTRAKLELISLEVNPFLVSELVAQVEERGGTPDVPTLIIGQSGDRVEISVLDQRRLIATHATWLPAGDAARHVSPLQMEINRCLVSLDQTHPGVEIDQVYLIADAEADNAVVEVLRQRFGTKVHELDLEQFGGPIPTSNRIAYAALLARGLTGAQGIIPRIDLINPRKPTEKPDHTKRYILAGSAAAVLLLGGTWWNFSSQMASLTETIDSYQAEISSNESEVKAAAADIAAAKLLSAWSEGDQDQLAALDQFHQLLPGTDRLYLTELKSIPQSGAKLMKIVGAARARSRGDVDDLQQKLADAGWQVKPVSPIEAKKDPDYPWQFVVEAELPRTEPVAPKAATTSPTPTNPS